MLTIKSFKVLQNIDEKKATGKLTRETTMQIIGRDEQLASFARDSGHVEQLGNLISCYQ